MGGSFSWTLRETVHIGCFAVLGVLLRVYFSESVNLAIENFYDQLKNVDRDSTDQGVPLAHSFLFSLFAGCFFLALVNKTRESLKREEKREELDDTIPQVQEAPFLDHLLLGISTGFCGSLTTLSSFLNEAPNLWFRIKSSNSTSSIDNIEFSIGYLTIETMFTGFSISFAGYILGLSVGERWELEHWSSYPNTFRRIRVFTEIFLTMMSAAILSSLLFVLIYAFYADADNDKKHFNLDGKNFSLVFSILFAPFGALVRWRLSVHNGRYKKLKWFKVGTFYANIIGCIIIAISSTFLEIKFKLKDEEDPSEQDMLLKGFLEGINDGFAGSLTTVSTFIGEIHSADWMKDKFKYSIATLALCQSSIFIIYAIAQRLD